MTIYIDVVLIENLIMNYIILLATGLILKIKIKHIRLIIGSLLGAIYTIIGYMGILEIYSSFILKIILSIMIVYIGNKEVMVTCTIKALWRIAQLKMLN